MKIETKRLIISTMTENELLDLIKKNASVNIELSNAYQEMFDNCKKYVNEFVWFIPWKICIIGTEQEVGYASFKGFNKGYPEIGYGINEEYQGNGYATEAINALCNWAMSMPGVIAIEAETEEDNNKSINVLTKIGFIKNGIIGKEGPKYILKGIKMKYLKTNKYDNDLIKEKIMGPNPLKLEEELMLNNKIKPGSVVMDLGSGQGLTSVFLAKEYGFKVYAADLWSDPAENKDFFEKMGLTENEIIPVKADATDLQFEKDFFDAIVSTDSYNYFGRDEKYLDEKLLPFLRKDGYIYIVIPGMKKDCHNNIPQELLLSWTPEQLEYIHDIEYWKNIISKSENSEVVSIYEMESNEDCWNDWINCDNEYAINDKKAIDAGAGKYLNFIAIILRKI